LGRRGERGREGERGRGREGERERERERGRERERESERERRVVAGEEERLAFQVCPRQSIGGGESIPQRVLTRFPLFENNCLER
jgi:hypothetical protein